MGIKANIDLMRNMIAGMKEGTMDTTKLLTGATADQYDQASGIIRTMNDFKESNPALSDVFGNSALVDYIDEEAYKIGSLNASATRNAKEIQSVYSPSEQAAYSSQDYTGFQEGSKSSPDLLKIYLGMEENTFPVSEVSPSSWTKGEPAQGWRSIKEHSEFTLSEKPEGYDYNWPGAYGDSPAEDFRGQLSELTKSVNEGTYDPSTHGIKIDAAGYMPPGMNYDTDVDLANFTKSIGYNVDTEEYYMSVTDVWDFESEQYQKNWGKESSARSVTNIGQAKLMAAAGNPIGIYDRYTIPNEYIKSWGYSQSTEDNIIDGFKQID